MVQLLLLVIANGRLETVPMLVNEIPHSDSNSLIQVLYRSVYNDQSVKLKALPIGGLCRYFEQPMASQYTCSRFLQRYKIYLRVLVSLQSIMDDPNIVRVQFIEYIQCFIGCSSCYSVLRISPNSCGEKQSQRLFQLIDFGLRSLISCSMLVYGSTVPNLTFTVTSLFYIRYYKVQICSRSVAIAAATISPYSSVLSSNFSKSSTSNIFSD